MEEVEGAEEVEEEEVAEPVEELSEVPFSTLALTSVPVDLPPRKNLGL